jgi:hypothetical protein
MFVAAFEWRKGKAGQRFEVEYLSIPPTDKSGYFMGLFFFLHLAIVFVPSCK